MRETKSVPSVGKHVTDVKRRNSFNRAAITGKHVIGAKRVTKTQLLPRAGKRATDVGHRKIFKRCQVRENIQPLQSAQNVHTPLVKRTTRAQFPQ